MNRRTSYKVVTFRRPFMLRGLEREQPAGAYTIETGEDLVADRSSPTYRGTTTAIFLPARPGGSRDCEIATIDPHELVAAQERDAEVP